MDYLGIFAVTMSTIFYLHCWGAGPLCWGCVGCFGLDLVKIDFFVAALAAGKVVFATGLATAAGKGLAGTKGSEVVLAAVLVG